MSKRSVLISSLAAAVVVGGLAYWALAVDDTPVPIPAANEGNQNKNPNAIASKWQWENFTGSKPAPKAESEKVGKPGPTGEQPFDVVEIYNILQSIELDDHGRVVPNQAAKRALEKGFDDLGPNLSPEAMAELQDLIRIGLPGEAGEEAARVLEDYYQFRLAEIEFNQQTEFQSSPGDRYEELVQLRRRFLGNEIANELFALDDTQARHMIATMAIQQNDELTDEEKQSELEALQGKLNDRLQALGELKPEEVAREEVRQLRENGASSAEIYSTRAAILGPVKAQELAAADREEAQWQSRFSGFWQARQHVMQAGLEEAERDRQIEQLLGQHFSPEEMERARLTTFDWQTRDRE